MASKKLPMSGEQPSKLGMDTIMDRTLAARHGAPYVHAVAFAIDVDRVLAVDPDGDALPFGWEVMLTEAYLEQELSPGSVPEHASLLEDTCLSILERPRGDSPLGGQFVFAVYSGVRRGVLPESLMDCFASWKKPPRGFAEEVAALWEKPDLLPQLAQHCLNTTVHPSLVPPVVEALKRMG